MKAKFILVVFLLFSIFTFAKHVPVDYAMKTGKNYYYERINQIKDMKYSDISLTLYHTYNTEKSEPAYYIFNVGNNGFIIVSAEDATVPILGYDFNRNFNMNKIAPPLAEFMNGYARQINTIRQHDIVPTESILKQWQELNYDSPAKSIKSVQTVTPLILAQWDQGFPYSAQCPADAAGDGGHVYTGCVAVAMAQVMKYYNYPVSGTGSYTHSTFANGGYGNQTVNFANQTYSWYQMPYSCNTSVYYDEVAKLMFHVGVAVHMHWGTDGSSSQTSLIASGLQTYYKYDHSITTLSKASYSETAWKTLLKNSLDIGRPLVYAGSGATSGHAWNCDGYQGNTGSEEFHMNWGWGGYNDGFFTLDNLYAPASPGQPAESLMNNQQIVANIFPEANYPQFCPNQQTFTATAGNFEDGSGNQNYQNNSNCTYLIQPSCGSYIRFQFDKFDLDPNDAVYIYDGPTTSDNLLAVYHGGETTQMVYGTGSGSMLINFVSGGSITATGWAASYFVDFCRSNILYTAPSGSFSDGSGYCEYKKSSSCSWIISPPNAISFTLNFTAFALAQDADFVSVYKNDMSTPNLVQKYTWQAPPTGSLVVNAPIVVLRFFTNSTVNAQGWALNYDAVINNIKAEAVDSPVSDIYIYPNPFSDDAQISYTLGISNNVSLCVTNLLGKELYKSDKFLTAGHYEFSLKAIVPDISNGIYFISLKTDKNSITKKIVCAK
ncbi:MAG: C10 family peptidase [Bacteroidia bacterium]|nr:C10 family peptidase [Bacteroidia bacterium]